MCMKFGKICIKDCFWLVCGDLTGIFTSSQRFPDKLDDSLLVSYKEASSDPYCTIHFTYS